MTTAVKLAFVTALAVEHQVLAQVGPGASFANNLLLQSGVGVARARLSIERALGQGANGVVLFGFAGGLRQDATPGTLLVPNAIRYQNHMASVDSDCHQRVCAAVANLSPVTEPLLCVDAPLCTLAEKADAIASGFACDMESAAVDVANARGVPAVVVKVVLDGPQDLVPPLALAFADADGNRRLPTLGSSLFNVRQWSQLLGLLPNYRLARRRLGDAAAGLANLGSLP